MKRRMFLAAGAVSATAAVWPTGTGVLAAPAQVDVGMFAAAVARARQDLEASKLTALTEAMPGLLSLAQATMDSAAGAYRPRAAGLTSQLLTVAGHVAYRTSDEAAAASFAADARDFAEEAADPVAAAEAERVTAVVARRSGDVAATGLMMGAADRLEHATGLTEPAAVAVWAETICSTAYTAAGFGSLDDADGLLREARTRLGTVESPTRFTTNDVGVFAMSAAMNASWRAGINGRTSIRTSRSQQPHATRTPAQSLPLNRSRPPPRTFSCSGRGRGTSRGTLRARPPGPRRLWSSVSLPDAVATQCRVPDRERAPLSGPFRRWPLG
jgi:hypothetical protein